MIKHQRRHFGFLTLGMFSVLVVGYILLAGVVWLSEEINLILQPTQAATVAEAPTVTASTISPTDYVQTILNNPENFRNSTIETSPALRRASGEQIFLMGF
ncbi:MAG: hypothetical protein VE98_C0001G0464 [candidate division Kazan bacterium GW2011_GWA1_50_15]|uniref:Uncharacterized protein n=2 Tax=Bacteria division Kazan-3B-28 TaxID=1798534 RepID=A0A0G1X7K0_UNCK3|nr:MAG: hypothetical protein VE98_C0001G0464 [candidate division Kazan bacterium GW2011_GWA1_50_15]KKW25848.1 MAG: hypothetical protein VE99_C0001G0487 [candidate division Kazan bacterium GW2011_GWC1_52_13]KKW27138.1 MAG: hypothetical protein VF00_C0001G0073 [candidate division Kazan bacterium GW2011_GWB1_52_7]HCR42426.1 hypothetical protein [Patescibacteria group bacterium]